MAEETNPNVRKDYGAQQLYKAEMAIRGMSSASSVWGDGKGEFIESPRIIDAVSPEYPEDKENGGNPFGESYGNPNIETNATGRVSSGRPDVHTPGFYGQETQRQETTDGELGLSDSARLASDSLNENMFAIVTVLEQINVNQKALTERLNILIDKTDSEDDEDEF